MTNRKNTPNEEQPNFILWRYRLVVATVVIIFLCLLARTAYIQIINPEHLRKQADMRSLRVTSQQVQRGIITDRNGVELAVSVPVMAIHVDPRTIKNKNSFDKKRAWQAFAEILDLNLVDLQAKIMASNGRFMYIKRQISPAVAKYVDELKLVGVSLAPESRRFYPTGEVSAQLVGMTNIDDKGIEGVERAYDDFLTGTPGKRIVRKDRLGNVIEDISVLQESEQANNIQLSIDQRIQSLAYQRLKKAVKYNGAISGSLVMIDVKTGEILAMVNSPSFNPNNRSKYDSYKLKNRAITDSYEPGSTIKPLVIASGLDNGVIAADSVIDTNPGRMRLGGRLVQDTRNRGDIALADILRYSSNMGVSKIALKLGHQRLLDTYYQFGFGNVSSLILNGESRGYMPRRTRWSEFENATLSFGYGMQSTTLQLAHAYATIGSGGLYRPLTIRKLDTTPLSERVLSKDHAEALLSMMETVVTKGGTGDKARIDGYRVAGKTGTSRKAIAGGYGDDYVALFAGVAPVSNPRFALVVVIDSPSGDRYYGGVIAAPVFAEVMERTLQMLNVTPDEKQSLTITAKDS
ncbi:penicillin-binding protein 2 [Moritella sp. Urea-trap-13]|uniref:peptidoglycan D,D-transpeptidase FtsI family protein n=1 Tax=Moritella sp. Urea-trap-13 TaxID=2058327 RepID=UPI000C339841|nr:penicillin-binding transpeptidase domain-containing protein [Moritella sp. Urea-trap-13]PKH05102.1 peptidoglycan glycosyltransferase FtsI [Moritella sp. Urea-trap-13]